MESKIIRKRILFLTLLTSLFFIFNFTIASSEAHVVIIADGESDIPGLVEEAHNTATELESRGYEVLELYQEDATTKNIMKGMYNADAVIYLGHGGYQTGHYDNNGGTATPPFAMVGSNDFVWGIDDQMREGWYGNLFTAPYKQNIPVILSHACFSTGWVNGKQVANPIETIYNFSQMFTGAGANYYASAYYGSYGGNIVVDWMDEFFNGATSFQDANNKNSAKITKSNNYNGATIWRNDNGYNAFVGDWSATFPSASQTTPYDGTAAEAWYQSILNGYPIVKSTSPSRDATNVPLESSVTLTFTENIQAGTNFNNIYIKNLNTNTNVDLASATVNGAILTLNPLNNFLLGDNYQVFIPAGAVKDTSNNNLANDYLFNFQATSDITPPTVSSTNPANDATGISRYSPVTITFNENIMAGANFNDIYIKNLTDGSIVTLASKTISGKILTLKTTTSKIKYTLYEIFIPTGAINDLSGNALTSDYTFKFRTTSDITTPRITATSPKNWATGVSLTSRIVITFSESIRKSTNFSGIYAKNLTTGNKVSLSSVTTSGRFLYIVMASKRIRNNRYQVYIPAKAVKDAVSNNLKNSYTLYFRTRK